MESNKVNLTDDASEEKQIKLQFKKTSFDRELKAFIKQSIETIEEKYGMAIELGEDRPELTCLKSYVRIYGITAPEEHYQYFEMLFNRRRNDILNCMKDDRWIRTGNIIIQYGEGIKSSREVEEKRRQVRVMISDIFIIACDLQAHAQKSYDGMDAKFANDAAGKNLIRPNILLLHLMRIFYHIIETSDKVQLGAIVDQLETTLGITKKTKTIVQEEANNTKPKSQVPMTGLSSVFSMAMQMMNKFGYTPPEGMEAPSEEKILEVVDGVFGNPATQNTIQGMLSSLQGCNNIGDAIQGVVKSITDPATMAAIQNSTMGVSNISQLGSFHPPNINNNNNNNNNSQAPDTNQQFNPQSNPQFNPQPNPQFNPQFNSQLNQQLNPQMNPQLNPQLNPQMNPQMNSQFNPQLNSQPNVNNVQI